MLYVVDIEGVLSETDAPIPIAAPMKSGQFLYQDLIDTVSFHLVSECSDRDLVREWLLKEGFTRWITLEVFDDIHPNPLEWKKEVVAKLMASNHRPAFYITGAADVAGAVSEMGVPALTLSPATNLFPVRDHYKSWGEKSGMVEAEVLHRREQEREAASNG